MPPFELDFDKFDMLSEFPDLDHYNNPSSGMIHHGASGPLLSSSALANQSQQPHQGNSASSANQPQGASVHGQGGAGQTGGQNNSTKHNHRHNITDYSPDWAWSDVSIKIVVVWITVY